MILTHRVLGLVIMTHERARRHQLSDNTEAPSDFSHAERAMWTAFRTGSVFDAQPDTQGVDHPPPEGLRVRAEALVQLLIDGPPALPGKVASLKLRGLQITGRLDLSGLEVATYVELAECNFEEPVWLTGTPPYPITRPELVMG